MSKMNLKRLGAESFLIVFSVLFALFLSQLVEQRKLRKQKEQALNNIYIELSMNKATIDRWLEKHTRIRDRLIFLANNPNDTATLKLSKSKFLDFNSLTQERSLIDALLNSTAWEAAKSTEIIAEFDFELVQDFTRVFEIQRIITENTMAKFLDIYFSREGQDMSYLQGTLFQLQTVMSELVGQEQLLANLLDELVDENWEADK